jgi:hypothetical protein
MKKRSHLAILMEEAYLVMAQATRVARYEKHPDAKIIEDLAKRSLKVLMAVNARERLNAEK